MKQVLLHAQTRDAFGRASARRLREEGRIPAELYGESGNRHLTLGSKDFEMAWRRIAGSAALIEIKVEGEEDSTYAIIKDSQRESTTDRFLHLDLFEIVRGREMEADVPVITRGNAHGVRNFGGVLEVNTTSLTVRCRPRHLPENIVVDVTDLEIGKALKVGDLTPPEGVTFLNDSELNVVSCGGASGSATEDDAEADAEAAPAEAAS